MEPRFLTVAEAARYLRLNPRSVYVLAQRGGIPASRVTGKWLFPVHLLDEWLEASARQRGAGDRPVRGRATLPPGSLFLAGSDDPALELLPDALRGQEGHPLLFVATAGSLGGLAALAQGRADVAACAHLAPGSGEPDLSYIPRHLPGRPAVVVNGFVRELGLLVWTGNPRKVQGVGDLRRGLRFVNRQPGSATRGFTDEALAAAGVERGSVVGYREEVSTQWAVALRVLRGEADVGVATRAVATALSLGFVPLARERFDLVVPKDTFFQPPIQTLLEAIRSERFRQGLERVGGYDLTRTGRVLAEVS